MNSYGSLARWYDGLTTDIPYESFADFYESIFSKHGRGVSTVLDFCCGTGAITQILAARGYDMTAVDGSPEMLAEAAQKLSGTQYRYTPLLLCQEASCLDLNDTVDAAVCCLDGFNYLPPEELPKVLMRLALFISPGGLLIFDVNTPERLQALDGGTFVDEREGLLCLWRAEYDRRNEALVCGVDIFTRRGRFWNREQEEHIEYAHSLQALRGQLEAAGFEHVTLCENGPQSDQGRVFFIAERKQ